MLDLLLSSHLGWLVREPASTRLDLSSRQRKREKNEGGSVRGLQQSEAAALGAQFRVQSGEGVNASQITLRILALRTYEEVYIIWLRCLRKRWKLYLEARKLTFGVEQKSLTRWSCCCVRMLSSYKASHWQLAAAQPTSAALCGEALFTENLSKVSALPDTTTFCWPCIPTPSAWNCSSNPKSTSEGV